MKTGETDYQELWRFVGKESKLDVSEIHKEAKVKIQFLPSKEIIPIITRDMENDITRNAEINAITKEELLEYLKENFPNVYLCWKRPEETNGRCYVIPFIKKQGLTLPTLPTANVSDYDVLIYINEGNIELRKQQWSKKSNYSFTSDDIRLFLVIHEMIHAYKRLNEETSVDPEQEDYDMMSSSILHSWKSHCYQSKTNI